MLCEEVANFTSYKLYTLCAKLQLLNGRSLMEAHLPSIKFTIVGRSAKIATWKLVLVLKVGEAKLFCSP